MGQKISEWLGNLRHWASRFTRYQGAIIRDDHILLIKYKKHATGQEYWVLPGGGREPNETEEACVQREMWEETGLKVAVERLLLYDTANPTGGYYKRSKTYLCRADKGEAQPGYEPEEDVAKIYTIAEVGWFKLGSSASWDELVKTNPFTYPLLQKIQAVLGYAGGAGQQRQKGKGTEEYI